MSWADKCNVSSQTWSPKRLTHLILENVFFFFFFWPGKIVYIYKKGLTNFCEKYFQNILLVFRFSNDTINSWNITIYHNWFCRMSVADVLYFELLVWPWLEPFMISTVLKCKWTPSNSDVSIGHIRHWAGGWHCTGRNMKLWLLDFFCGEKTFPK